MPQLIGWIADILGILGAVFAFFAWIQSLKLGKDIEKEKKRQEKKIRIILSSGEHKIELPFRIRRDEFTRAEVQGLLGILPMKEKGKRYAITHLSTQQYMERLWEVRDGNEDTTFIIPLKDDEYQQFDLTVPLK